MWKKSCVIMLSISLSASPCFAQGKKTPKTFRIGVLKTASNASYDADEKGFEKGLFDAGYKEKVGVIYDRENAWGEAASAEAIARKFLQGKPDLIHSIGKSASQPVVKTIRTIPIVFSAVTDPVEAGLVPRNSSPGATTGTNVTGVSDRWPISLQFEMFMKIVPKAKKWGTIYNAADPKTLIYIKEMREIAKKSGIELIEATISSKAETTQAAQFLAGKVQAFHITDDSTAVSSFEAIAKTCNEKKIPLFSGDLSTVSRGGIAAYGLDYSLVGLSAGWRAEGILSGQKPGDIPWDLCDSFSLIINEKAAKSQGVAIPPMFLKKANKVIE